jgi:hypothetical protein
MSRLDFHVTKVQGKMLLTGMLQAVAWTLLVYAAVVWVVILVGKLFQLHLPREWVWFWSGLGVAVATGIGYAVWRRPTRQHAAVAIDERLGLKEKFSTALYVRPSTDPFAAAAVRDAEVTAERVHLQDKFPVRFPMTSLFAAGVGLVAFLTGVFVSPMDLLGREALKARELQEQARETDVKQEIKKAIASIEAAPVQVQKEEGIQLAKQDLRQMLARPVTDPTTAARKAQDALEDVKAQTRKIREAQNYAQALNEMKQWKQLADKPIDESGPVGKAQAQLAKGNFSEAVETLKKSVDDFDKMEKQEQQKAADQMKAMAQQLQQMANNPQQQQQMQQQLQQMGATQQQAQQMVQKMQQAANGDKQAQQQLQQMGNQMMQQMNNGQGPTPQQIQQAQAMMQQLQQQANGQAQAQQLAQSAAQLARAMQQAQAGQQQAQAGQKGAQQGNQPQPGGQPAQQQQAGNQGAQQQAQQQMQQQIAQMQAMAQAAAAAQAGQQPGGDGAQPGQDGGQPGGGQPGGEPGQQAGGNQPGGGGQGFKEGDPNRRGGDGDGGGGAGQASGRRPGPQAAPFGVKGELSRSETIEKGKILAATFVQADALKGESKADFREAVQALEAEATDEVDQTRVSRQAREAVKEYHRSMTEDAAAAGEGAATGKGAATGTGAAAK